MTLGSRRAYLISERRTSAPLSNHATTKPDELAPRSQARPHGRQIHRERARQASKRYDQAQRLLLSLNQIHPFRDGNARAQSAYVSRLAERAEHPIYWSRVDVNKLRRYRLAGGTGDEAPLAQYLDEMTAPPGPQLLR